MNRQANPGETIRIKERPWKGQEFVVTVCPQRFRGGKVEHHTWVEEPATPTVRSGPMYFSSPDDYVIVTTYDCAKPGDTIEVIAGCCDVGNQHVVIECPPGSKNNPPGCAWHKNSGTSPSFWRREYYKIVKRKSEGVSTQSIDDLEKSLRQKRDALLRGWFT